MITVKILDLMIVFMGYGARRTQISAGKAGYAVFRMPDQGKMFFLVIFENIRRADVSAHGASPACLFVKKHFYHTESLLMVLSVFPFSVMTISSGMDPRAWVAQERHGS